MKKRVISVITVFILVLMPIFSVCVSAQEPPAKLSPAFDIIAARQTMIKSGLVRENVQFTQTDFKQCLGVSELDYIKITKAPAGTDGLLVVGSMTVSDGQKIDASLLSMLTFVPASDEIDIAVFSFCGDGDSSGAEIKCKLRISDRVNYAPTIAQVDESQSPICAEIGKYVSSTLSATDPEGDRLTYEIIKYPAHGTLKLTDASSGAYTYTPYPDYAGRDSFEYVARDEWGNYTTPSTVNISVSRKR